MEVVPQRFTNALAKCGLTVEQLALEGWRYAGGGSSTDRYKYWCTRYGHPVPDVLNTTGLCPPLVLPMHEEKCVCEQSIQKNYYITKDDKHFLVWGSCCIKRFIPTGRKKTCERCHATHKNRLDNLCHNCREKKRLKELERSKLRNCEFCGKKHTTKEKLCPACITHTCPECGKWKNDSYPRCYKCHVDRANKKRPFTCN